MSYKMKNIFCLTALALILSLGTIGSVNAQGVVSLAGEAAEEDPALQDIPNEDALFADDNDVAIPLEAQTPAQPAPTTPQEDVLADIKLNEAAPLLPVETDSPFAAATPLPTANAGGVGILGNRDFTALDDNVFSTMSNLEKQTAVLDLELRKERVRNEIEALKNQRKAAIEQEEEKREAKRRQKIEWEKAQEAKVVVEQQKLRELDITFERLRQEKMLNAYKNKMLEEQQKWIAENAKVFEKLQNLNAEKQEILEDAKNKLTTINAALKNIAQQASEVKSAYKKDIADLYTQISVLKARIEAQEKELLEKQNPFADGSENAAKAEGANSAVLTAPDLKLPNMYAIMEIRGQGNELIAKLINQDGTPFYVKKGTSLQSGHIIDDITSTYVRADKNGIKDYLYFAAGGILPMELETSSITPKATTEEVVEESTGGGMSFVTSDGVPGMGSDMMAR